MNDNKIAGKYIHFWYQDYVDKHNNSLNGLFGSSVSVSQLLSQTLTLHLNAFQKQRLAMAMQGSEDIQNAINLYQDLGHDGALGSNIEAEIRKMMDASQQNITGARKTGYMMNGENLGYLQIAHRFAAGDGSATAAQLKDLADNFGVVIDDANDVLAYILDVMNKAYPDLEVASIIEHINRGINSLSSEEIYRKAISKMPRNQLLVYDTQNLSNTQQNIINYYQRILIRIEALKQFAPNGVRATEGSVERGHEIAALIGKIGGSISSAGGILGEIAVSHGFTVAMQEGLKNIGGAVQVSTIGQNTKVSYQEDANLTNAKNVKINSMLYNKGDVLVQLSLNNVSMSYAINVKRTAANQSNPRHFKSNLKLHQEGNLLQMIERAQALSALGGNQGSFLNFVYNTAAGHTDATIEGLSGSDRKMKKYKGRGESAVSNVWKSVIDYVVAANFLDSIAGDARDSSNNIIFMVINDQIYTIADILEQLMMNPNAINSVGGKQRYKFSQLNIWQPTNIPSQVLDKNKAEERSNAVYDSLTAAFNSTKITTKLNMSLLKF